MTHEELLEKISNVGAKFEGNAWAVNGGSWSIDVDLLIKNTKALRTIVELHTGSGINNRCVTCANGNKCETIQVIEKELECR